MEARTRALIFDPFAGISGDMILGALIDLGLGDDWLRDLVDRLPLDLGLSVTTVSRGSLKATAVNVETPARGPARGLHDILEIIEKAGLSETAREVAASTFTRLAEVEGALHGTPPDQVHFHEVGAADAIVDVLGAASGIAQLAVDHCFTRPVAIGKGWVSAQHGALPVPAPATLRLLEGLPVIDADMEGELTTPTGAVILAVLTRGARPPASYVPIRSGFGAGSRDPSTHPNCLRVVLAELESDGPMLLLQADLDDMSPEYLPPVLESLHDAGAIDVWTHTVQMKKARTGIRIEALVPHTHRETVTRALLEGSTTLGLRFWPVSREVLPRSAKRIEWRGFRIRLKIAVTPEGHVRCKPEYDDVVEAARALGVPPWQARREIERTLDQQPGC